MFALPIEATSTSRTTDTTFVSINECYTSFYLMTLWKIPVALVSTMRSIKVDPMSEDRTSDSDWHESHQLIKYFSVERHDQNIAGLDFGTT